MLLLSCREIKKDFGDKTVLKNISFDINAGERIGLIGDNGAGKTTLANVIFGELQQDSGAVKIYQKEMKIGYLFQTSSYSINTINRNTDDNSKDDSGYFLETTSMLGLKKVQDWEEIRLNGLSGGERTKLSLAKIWASKPDMLILDEPTNHMDFQGIEWLIREIERFNGTVIIISHDRYFLDKTVKKIIEMDQGIVREFQGNYSYYRREKERMYESQLNQYLNEKKYKEKIQGQIDQLTNWSNKAHRESRKAALESGNKFGGKEYNRAKAKKMDIQIKSRLKRLKKLEIEGIEKPKEEQRIRFGFDDSEKRGNNIIEAKSIFKKFGDRVLFQDSSFYIQRRDRIGLIGPNGCGKTTLVKAIIGEEFIDRGELWVSSSLKKAYLSQDMIDLEEGQTVLEALNAAEGAVRTSAMTLLGNMGFNEEMIKRKIGTLSLGERTRVKLAKLILEENDFLILDEPTNHLDLHSRERLEQALADYNGTILIASHDRYMLERVCDKLLVFEKGKIKRTEKGFKEFKEEKNGRSDVNIAKTAEEKMLIENRIALILGQIGSLAPGDDEYMDLDREFKELIKRKKELT